MTFISLKPDYSQVLGCKKTAVEICFQQAFLVRNRQNFNEFGVFLSFTDKKSPFTDLRLNFACTAIIFVVDLFLT